MSTAVVLRRSHSRWLTVIDVYLGALKFPPVAVVAKYKCFDFFTVGPLSNTTARNCYCFARFADGDLFRLHSADDGAVTWLQDVAAKALAK